MGENILQTTGIGPMFINGCFGKGLKEGVINKHNTERNTLNSNVLKFIIK